jgi:succinyl-diaminopimelate desuccinylase
MEHGTPVVRPTRCPADSHTLLFHAPGYAAAVKLDLSRTAAELTADLVDVESVSGHERPLADLIAAALAEFPHLTVHRDGDAIVARTQLGRAQRVAIAGHIDTVPEAGNLPSRIEDGVLYGLGSCDMKSGVAVQLRLAAQLAEPTRDVTFVFYDGEEVESERNGLLRLSRSSPELLAADFAVLMEPTDAIVEGGCQGTMRAEVAATGERAHSARSWMGRNAIHAAGPILDVLREYEPREPVVDGLRYHEGLNAVGITGGVAGNVIPDECVVTVNYRFAPDRSAQRAQEHLRWVFAEWDLRVTDVAGGARPGLDHPAAASFAAAMGGEPRAKFGWTDVARFDALGIPAVNFGPGDPLVAHARHEHVRLAQIEDCEARMRAWLTS